MIEFSGGHAPDLDCALAPFATPHAASSSTAHDANRRHVTHRALAPPVPMGIADPFDGGGTLGVADGMAGNSSAASASGPLFDTDVGPFKPNAGAAQAAGGAIAGSRGRPAVKIRVRPYRTLQKRVVAVWLLLLVVLLYFSFFVQDQDVLPEPPPVAALSADGGMISSSPGPGADAKVEVDPEEEQKKLKQLLAASLRGGNNLWSVGTTQHLFLILCLLLGSTSTRHVLLVRDKLIVYLGPFPVCFCLTRIPYAAIRQVSVADRAGCGATTSLAAFLKRLLLAETPVLSWFRRLIRRKMRDHKPHVVENGAELDIVENGADLHKASASTKVRCWNEQLAMLEEDDDEFREVFIAIPQPEKVKIFLEQKLYLGENCDFTFSMTAEAAAWAPCDG
eukprot:g2272.t1